MTIRAQQSQITSIGLPVLEASSPCELPILWDDLFTRVDMVDIKRAKVIKAALNALATKGRDYLELSFPIPRVFMNLRGILIPVYFSAFGRAKPLLLSGARTAACGAFTIGFPSAFKIARLSAKFAGAVFDAVCMHFKSLAAMRANNVNRFLSHELIISNYKTFTKPKYFDIACKRIEQAYAQPDMFVEPVIKPTQDKML